MLYEEPPSAKLLEKKAEDVSPADMFYYTSVALRWCSPHCCAHVGVGAHSICCCFCRFFLSLPRYFKLKGSTDTSTHSKKKRSSKEGLDLDYMELEEGETAEAAPVDFAGCES